ncbi:arachidonate 5-lipoxygenase-like protein [Labeo rohita]|uniref:Arachidonate 5-lipoxygenase-like protein n=1 Tax=Labeo rohita TaxID=84645 RepID=A0A498NNC0_LABRO|nr:arachidonate 5-lipoxygenase-like protein [Labeo rohita]
MYSLCYLPTAGRMTLTVIKCRNLKAMDITGYSDPYVKVSLICDGRRLKKRKTTTKKNTLNPVYNEAIIFDIPPENVEQVSLSITVMDYDRYRYTVPRKIMTRQLEELTTNYTRVREQLNINNIMVRKSEELKANYTKVREQLSFYEAFKAQSLNCDMTSTTFKGKLYFFSCDKLNWLCSRAFCVSKGADLVTITSQTEQRFLLSKIKDWNWIGLNDLETEGHWVWVNNQTLNETGVQSISRMLNVPVSTVGAIIRKWKEHQFTINRPRSGAPRKIPVRGVQRIIRRVLQEPRTTQAELQEDLASAARLSQDDKDFQVQRKVELEFRQKKFRWIEWSPGFPRSIDAKEHELPKEAQFDEEKQSDFKQNSLKAIKEFDLDKTEDYFESWKDIADIENIFEHCSINNTLLENVMQDWNKDDMFGYQFLNGCNPAMISKCMQLPDKFPVTHEMVEGSLTRGHTLQEELQAGNIYIVDFEILKEVPAVSKERYLTAPICLLYKNELDQMLPIAIQDIKARGMEDVPKYYYRDDGMMIWEAINSFVSAVVKIYYGSDEAVQQDVEIQGFVKDVAFGMNNSDKFPKSLKTREQLVEYLTVVIFTASAQHAAVNFGQFDWYGWVPNSPSTMRKPPPQQKGQVDMKYIVESLPNRGSSREILATVWSLTRTESNEV